MRIDGSGAKGRTRPRRSVRMARAAARLVPAVFVAGCLAGCGATTAGSSPTSPSGSGAPSTTTTPAPPTTAQHVATGTTLHWAACTTATGPVGYQCATLQVPLDYADPTRGTIGIALDRHQAPGHPIGSLLMDPGGPGESGIDFLPELMPDLPNGITSSFNVVGFDPRGVGRSDPVTCGTGPQLDQELSVDPSPSTAAGLASLVAADRRLAAGCEARSRRVLPWMSTVNAARDMDRIRAAVGDSRLTYLGFSYGTLLGATYAQLFPTHVRALVLDGALDPALTTVPTVQAQAAALDHELVDFFASCAAGHCGWRPSDDLAATFDQLVVQVRAHPLRVSGSSQTVGPAVLLYGTASALYSEQSWPALGQALTDLQAGNGAPMLAMFNSYLGRNANGTYANTVEAETAVDCLDAPHLSVAQVEAAGPATEQQAPVFGLLDLYSELSCSVWPVPATGQPGVLSAPGSPPIVVVGSTGDPITPYAWAQALAGQLQHGVLVTRDGYGHTGYLYSSCVRSAVDRYLLTTAPPASGLVCPSD